jgi:DNA-binding response OmpR family regulator
MRALVIDDQREFFESIRSTLMKSGFVSDYAPDLSSAQRILTERDFDLILTDLQMPPGNWGGLDVIKMVRHLDRVVPLFVVSGRGSLAECIQAVRLGASDYLQKEVFATEFHERAKSRFARPYAIEHIPSLIAYLFRLFEEEPQEYATARRLIDVYESTIKLLSIMIMAEQVPKAGAASISSLLEQWNMGRPSLGHYVSFLFESIDRGWDGNLLTALRASELARMRDDCDRLTKCRNEEFGHSTVISHQRAVEIVETFSKVLLRVLNAISFLRRFQLFVAHTLAFDGASFTANGKLLCGSNLHHPTAVVVLKGAVPTGHAVVIVDNAMIADVNPLIEIVTSPTDDWNVYKIYDKLGKNGIEFAFIPK